MAILVASSAAAPTSPSSPKPNFTVYIRDINSGYHMSPSMSHIIAARDALLPLHKRSHANIRACNGPACTGCTDVFDSYFSFDSKCIDAISAGCIVVSQVQGAHVTFWSKTGCKGKESGFDYCLRELTPYDGTGAGSIEVHKGCTI